MTMLVTMRIPVGRGRFWYVQFDPSRPADFAPLQNLNGARMAQQGAPLLLKPLKENGAGAPLLHSPPKTAQEWRNSPQGEFLGELEKTRTALADRASELARLDDILAPVWAEENEIKEALIATHDFGKAGLKFNPNGKQERRSLFERRTEIAVAWGKTKEERRQAHFHVRSLEREAERLRKLIEKEDKRGKKANA